MATLVSPPSALGAPMRARISGERPEWVRDALAFFEDSLVNIQKTLQSTISRDFMGFKYFDGILMGTSWDFMENC